MNDLQFVLAGFIVFGIGIGNGNRLGHGILAVGSPQPNEALSGTNRCATQRHLMAMVMGNGWLLESQGNLFFLNEMRNGVKRHEQCLHCSNWLFARTICRIVVDTENYHESGGYEAIHRNLLRCLGQFREL